jgi:hypothetical protein
MVALHVEMFGEEYLTLLAAAEAGGFQIVPEPSGGLLLGGVLSGLLLRRTTAAPNNQSLPTTAKKHCHPEVLRRISPRMTRALHPWRDPSEYLRVTALIPFHIPSQDDRLSVTSSRLRITTGSSRLFQASQATLHEVPHVS